MTGQPYCAISSARGLVIGIGNPDRGDDGIGRAVVRKLAGRLSPDIRVMERGGDILTLIEIWAAFDTVVLIDAAAVMTEPGRIHRVEPIVEPLAPGFAPGSTHAFGVADAIELARNLDMLPSRLIVYAIEAAGFEIGADLSPAVAATIDEVASRIATEFGDEALDAQTKGGHAHA